jgi:hypothetical protein
MFRLLQPRGRRHTKRDYTKDTATGWFILVLVLLAAYVIIRTLSVNHSGKDTERSEKQAVAQRSNNMQQLPHVL